MMTTHSPVKTRSRVAEMAAVETATTGNVLEAVLRELQQIREERRLERQEQQRLREEMEASLRERDSALRRLEEQFTAQLSPSKNISGNENSNNMRAMDVDSSAIGAPRIIKLKPDIYDGAVPLREFISQFSLIACAISGRRRKKQ